MFASSPQDKKTAVTQSWFHKSPKIYFRLGLFITGPFLGDNDDDGGPCIEGGGSCQCKFHKSGKEERGRVRNGQSALAGWTSGCTTATFCAPGDAPKRYFVYICVRNTAHEPFVCLFTFLKTGVWRSLKSVGLGRHTLSSFFTLDTKRVRRRAEIGQN